jgi:cell division transport system ATP-binding protein
VFEVRVDVRLLMADTTVHEEGKRHPIVSFYHTSKRYGRRIAVRDVTLHVERGEFLFLVGASGAGKSTLLRLAYMEEQPTEGQVTVAGFVSSRMRRNRVPQLRRKVGLIFQDFKLLEDRDVFENVAFPLYVTGANRSYIRKTVLDIISRVGLYAKRNSRPLELSGGEQQRVAIARALVNSPFVLLADEPTGNLDPVVANEILKLLFKINIAGTAVIMATHDHETVRRYGQRIVHIEQGELVQDEGAFDRWSRKAQQPVDVGPPPVRQAEHPTPTLQRRAPWALPDTPQSLTPGERESPPPHLPPMPPDPPKHTEG